MSTNTPIVSISFAGSAGSGKTYLRKLIEDYLYERGYWISPPCIKEHEEFIHVARASKEELQARERKE